MNNRITELFEIQYPIISGGMVWCSGWRLASAVSNAGGLGLIGAGSMNADLLREHIRKCRIATDKPFGVNVPLLYKHAEAMMDVIMEEKVPVVFTSAGSPRTWTDKLHGAGIKVAHVYPALNLLRSVKKQEWMLLWQKVLRLVGITERKRRQRWCLCLM